MHSPDGNLWLHFSVSRFRTTAIRRIPDLTSQSVGRELHRVSLLSCAPADAVRRDLLADQPIVVRSNPDSSDCGCSEAADAEVEAKDYRRGECMSVSAAMALL